MATELLDQLAETEVPPAPKVLQQKVHREINQTLLIQQAAELCLRALPWVLLHFGQAVLGLVRYTWTQRYEPDRRRGRE